MAVSGSSEVIQPTGLSKCLFDIIDKMQEDEKVDLLRHLGQRTRRSPRKTYIILVDYEEDAHTYSGHILDISVDGVFLQANHILKVGQELFLTLPFSSLPHALKVPCMVIWTTVMGMGLQFKGLTSEQSATLHSVVAAL